MGDDVRERILKKLASSNRNIFKSVTKQDPNLARLIIQVEGMHVYSILKSVVVSQRNDPIIKKLLRDYKVDLDSKSLRYFIPTVYDKQS